MYRFIVVKPLGMSLDEFLESKNKGHLKFI